MLLGIEEIEARRSVVIEMSLFRYTIPLGAV